jgi:hypothetical protein
LKITIEFDNGPALVLAPESLSLTQLNAEHIALVGTAGTYAIPIVSFPGSLATSEEIAARVVCMPDDDNMCRYDLKHCVCSLIKGHTGKHIAYCGHEPTAEVIATAPQ